MIEFVLFFSTTFQRTNIVFLSQKINISQISAKQTDAIKWTISCHRMYLYVIKGYVGH